MLRQFTAHQREQLLTGFIQGPAYHQEHLYDRDWNGREKRESAPGEHLEKQQWTASVELRKCTARFMRRIQLLSKRKRMKI